MKSNVDIGGDFEEKNMNETFAATANVPVNSNTKHSKDVRFLKNAQVPPNVQVPDNAFLSVNFCPDVFLSSCRPNLPLNRADAVRKPLFQGMRWKSWSSR